MREKAVETISSAERDIFLKRARQAETACRIDDWANSPGLQPPK
jgi:hypothetical protein